jgi:hypothetical protein
LACHTAFKARRCSKIPTILKKRGIAMPFCTGEGSHHGCIDPALTPKKRHGHDLGTQNRIRLGVITKGPGQSTVHLAVDQVVGRSESGGGTRQRYTFRRVW